ncbi:hypothetical protein M378DRAFT_161494 [Amanita muscaria Koide BX008]|uniref:Uncharacterized protein n=1 Tax=Amanita muscaria (strain Koide BX008) TaxID=946122 RepID=A0A0C2XAK6_AMAMK|nr:hypothetical protein M378DRAFT_161494 [Amanita muscaria Koide BX008]
MPDKLSMMLQIKTLRNVVSMSFMLSRERDNRDDKPRKELVRRVSEVKRLTIWMHLERKINALYVKHGHKTDAEPESSK